READRVRGGGGRHLRQGEHEGERLGGGEDKHHEARARRRVDEARGSGTRGELAERERADQKRIDRREGGNLGRGGETGLEPAEDDGDEPDGDRGAAPQRPRRGARLYRQGPLAAAEG